MRRHTQSVATLTFMSLAALRATPLPHARALRIDQAPRIDGVLDDACWSKAEPLTEFTQVLPAEAAVPSERTEVRFAYTRDVMFIAIRCFDRQPQARLMAWRSPRRDSGEEISGYLFRNPGLSRVAVDGDKIAGAALCGHDGRRRLIYQLAVIPAFRGRNIGRQLVDCIAGLRRARIARAIIFVAKDNDSGRYFWRRNGWEDRPAKSR